MNIRNTALAGAAIVVMTAVAMPASAQFYIEGNFGANWLSDIDVEDRDPDGVLDWEWSHETSTGFAIGARAGYGFGNGFRAEGEVTYRTNEFDQVCDPEGCFDEEGDLASTAIMASAYYDFLNDSGFTPFIGAGVGGAHLKYSYDGWDGSDSDWVLAAQARLGVAYAFMPNVALTADYTYFRAFDPSFDLWDDGWEQPTSDWENHTVMAGLRYTFDQPAAPVAPPVVAEPEPAAPVAQQVFLVFFDFDRSNLTPEANNTLDQVVVAHNQQQVTRIMVDGHTDRSGPASYNQGLSERRAESVRQGLIARGVAPDEIVTRAFGETQNLVPTPDGVREPQNRRVEIIFS